MEQNGCGKFNEISDLALESIRAMGFTHVWYTGVIEHASSTAYPKRPADDPLLVKGKAGSPYAIKDYFDVCPDLAENAEKRLEEFKALLERTKKAGLLAVIDFVPNHVARSYESDVRPETSFGKEDRTDVFFTPDNQFFYLEDEQHLMLPGGEYLPERGKGRVTGNNSSTWQPSRNDWYETVKLNYGHDYTQGAAPEVFEEIPDTWHRMNEVFAYWQGLGVQGFRCDMAHMVPMAFWKWMITHARERDKDLYIFGEAYDSDPMKLTQGNVLQALLDAGFDAVYDAESYDIVKGIYESGKWANDIDAVLMDESRLDRMLRYVENHDEVRVAHPKHWGGWGASVGKAASAILFGIGKGPVMLYSGQEVAEAAMGAEGFCDDNGRSTIFDYWSLPELCKWVNAYQFDGGRLDNYQKNLREWYVALFTLLSKPVFAEGRVYGLNHFNRENEKFGRLEGENCSGHWLYAFVRYTEKEAIVMVINLHPTKHLRNVEVHIPDALVEKIHCEKHLMFNKIEPCGLFFDDLLKSQEASK